MQHLRLAAGGGAGQLPGTGKLLEQIVLDRVEIWEIWGGDLGTPYAIPCQWEIWGHHTQFHATRAQRLERLSWQELRMVSPSTKGLFHAVDPGRTCR